MSWFPEVPPEADDEKEGALIADGVLVERRDVIRLSLGALAVWSLGWPQKALAEDVLGEERFAQSLTLEDLQFLLAD